MAPKSGCARSLSQRATSHGRERERALGGDTVGARHERVEHSPQRHDLDALDTFDALGHRDDPADRDAGPGRQPVGMEEAQRSVGQRAVAEPVDQHPFDVGAQVLRLDAHDERDLEGDLLSPEDVEIMADAPIALEVGRDTSQQLGLRVGDAALVDGDERLVPTAGPPQRRARLLHLAGSRAW